MKRALMLASATAIWVAGLQFVSGVVAPPREIDLQDQLRLDQAQLDRAPFDHARQPQRSESPGLARLDSFGFSVLSPIDPAPTFDPPSTTVALLRRPANTTASPASTVPTSAATTPTTNPGVTTTSPHVVTTTSPPPTTAAPTATTAAAPAGAYSPAAEADFVVRINNLRATVGVASMAVNAELANQARWWAKHMADSGNFSHSDIAALLDPWTIVGENIGYGPSVEAIFDGLVNSSAHYNNMIETRFTSVGVGVFIDASGRLWTAHVFGG
ncbi:MAG: CAP domain-containing protein [Actinomycetota bacterium]